MADTPGAAAELLRMIEHEHDGALLSEAKLALLQLLHVGGDPYATPNPSPNLTLS